MMLFDQIQEQYKQAFRDKDMLKKEILSFVIAAIKNKKIELQKDPEDDDVIAVIKKEIKSRKESIEFLQAAGNTEEVATENQKISVLEAYLPAMMPKEQLTELVQKAIIDAWITDPKKQRWQIIWLIMKDHKATVDGGMLNDIINTL